MIDTMAVSCCCQSANILSSLSPYFSGVFFSFFVCLTLSLSVCLSLSLSVSVSFSLTHTHAHSNTCACSRGQSVTYVKQDDCMKINAYLSSSLGMGGKDLGLLKHFLLQFIQFMALHAWPPLWKRGLNTIAVFTQSSLLAPTRGEAAC